MKLLDLARSRALALALAGSVAFGSLVAVDASAAFADDPTTPVVVDPGTTDPGTPADLGTPSDPGTGTTDPGTPTDPAPTAFTTSAASDVAGTAQVGRTVSAVPATWTPTPTFTFQWLRDGKDIDGAATQDYVVQPADAGHLLSVETTGTIATLTDSKTSAGIEVALGTLTPATPTIQGTATVFKKLTAWAGDWQPASTFTYRWYRGSSPISGATKSTYTLTPSDAGKSVSVHVAGHAAGYATSTVPSSPVKIRLATFSKVPAAKITGTATVTKHLDANHGTWPVSGVKFSYRWYSNGKPIAGATKSTFQLPISTAGKKIKVVVKGSKAGYASVSKTSASVTPKLMKFASTPKPQIAGTAQQGKSLTAHAGTWSPSGATLAYHWYRNGTAIGGATHTTYTATASDVGKQIRVAVKATKRGYSDARVVSDAVVPVAPPAPPAAAPAPAPSQQGYITPGAFCKDADVGVVRQAANGRSYRCGGHGADANGHYHWNTIP